MNPVLSVVWPTYRIGGLDLLNASIQAQRYHPEPFEVILVDAFFDYRASRYGFPFECRQFRPRDAAGTSTWPLYAVCAARNTGIKAAQGHTLVMTVDWASAASTWLQRLYDSVQEDPSAVWIGAHPHYEITKMELPLVDGFEEYLAELALLSRLRASGSAPNWYSVNFTRQQEPLDGGLYRGFEHGDEVHPRHFFAKNFACRTQVLRDVGMFDERFDGGHGLDDWDLADRLVVAGVKLRFCADAEVHVYKPPAKYIPAPPSRPEGNGGVFGREVWPGGTYLPELPVRILKERRLLV